MDFFCRLLGIIGLQPVPVTRTGTGKPYPRVTRGYPFDSSDGYGLGRVELLGFFTGTIRVGFRWSGYNTGMGKDISILSNKC